MEPDQLGRDAELSKPPERKSSTSYLDRSQTWDKMMGQKVQPRLPKETFVLILKWCCELDELNTSAEARELKGVLETVFKFTVQECEIKKDDIRPARVQVRKFLGDFIHKYYHKDNLFVIYYAGHGWGDKDTKDYKLYGDTSDSSKDPTNFQRATIVWESVDLSIANTDPGILVIFDSSNAGLLCQPKRGRRKYEILAACGAKQQTPRPSEESFTRALIWSLIQLSSLQNFTTTQLLDKIKTAPHYGANSDKPQLYSSRLQPEFTSVDSMDSIVISPNTNESRKNLEQTNKQGSVSTISIQPEDENTRAKATFSDSGFASTRYEPYPKEAGIPLEMSDGMKFLDEAYVSNLASDYRGSGNRQNSNDSSSKVRELSQGVAQEVETKFSTLDNERESDKMEGPKYHQQSQDISSELPETVANNRKDNDDIQSVKSDAAEIFSQASSIEKPFALEGEFLIIKLLAENEDLQLLFKEALSRMGYGRFVNNLRRLLKRFHRNLLTDANTKLEKLAVSLLGSRKRRARICQGIASLLRPDDQGTEAVKSISREENLAKFAFIEDWINQNQSLTGPSTDPNLDAELNLIDFSDEYDSETDDTMRGLPHLKEVANFFRTSSSFQTLLLDFRVMLLPRELKRIVQTIPSDGIWFSSKNDLSFINTAKAWVEDHTKVEWHWWPLKPRMKNLQPDQARILWRCFCGQHLWKEISTTEKELVVEILPYIITSEPSPPHLCKSSATNTRLRRPLKSWMMNIASIIFQAPAYGSSASRIYTPPGASGSIPASGVHQQGQIQSTTTYAINNQANPQSSTPGATGAQAVNSIMNNVLQPLWVLFAVQGSRPTLELDHISVSDACDDASFFKLVRRSHRRNRGRLLLWFSCWRLHHCDFVKLKKLAPKCIVSNGKELPQNQEYIYSPRPPTAINPPIDKHEFSVCLKACDQDCIWPSFTPQLFHYCIPPPEGSNALTCIPKKTNVFDVVSRGGATRVAWGLEARYRVSFAYLVAYHAACLSSAFGFWIWWLTAHPNDLQSAAIPVTVVTTLLSLLWSSAGFIKTTRSG